MNERATWERENDEDKKSLGTKLVLFLSNWRFIKICAKKFHFVLLSDSSFQSALWRQSGYQKISSKPSAEQNQSRDS